MSYPDDLQMEYVTKRKFKLTTPFKYVSPKLEIEVPAGFETDLASIYILRFVSPVLFTVLSGYGSKASVVHDYLYLKQGYFKPNEELVYVPVTRKFADRVYYEALRAEGVSRWRAAIFYFGVRLGGRSPWRM